LAESIKSQFDIDIELKKSDGGRFEITLDGETVFSKYKEYRFPAEGEIEKLLKERIG
jgi:selT/selW/selH-like putative selenoprotein